MQYVNCLYTTQGDYMCQKNQKLDAFYNKPIVEGFYADAPAPPMDPKLKALYDSVKNKKCINIVNPSDDCYNSMLSLYNYQCGGKTAPTCAYKPPASARQGAGIPVCNADQIRLIQGSVKNVPASKVPSDIFTCGPRAGP